MSKSNRPSQSARGGSRASGKAAKPAAKPTPAPRQAPARRPRMDPVAVGVLLLASLAAGLVAANNAGVLPAGVKRHLGSPAVSAPLGAQPEPASKPKPAAKPKPVAAPAKPKPVADQPAVDDSQAYVPVPEPRPAAEPQAPTVTPAAKAPHATEPRPKPAPAPAEPPAVKGRLSPSQRRDRLAALTPPRGFTPEWRGGSAVLSVDGNEIARGAADSKRVGLTFDGCFINAPVPRLLEILRNEHLHATFFLTGKFARQFPETVRQIAAAGHEIGNHSDTHPDFTRLDDAGALLQLERAEGALLPLAGEAYRPFFRPPLGGRNVRVLRNVMRHGFLPIYWTVDTLDWKPEATPDGVLAKVKAKGLRGGAIVLQHAGSAASVDALPRELAMLREAGFEPGPLSALLRP